MSGCFIAAANSPLVHEVTVTASRGQRFGGIRMGTSLEGPCLVSHGEQGHTQYILLRSCQRMVPGRAFSISRFKLQLHRQFLHETPHSRDVRYSGIAAHDPPSPVLCSKSSKGSALPWFTWTLQADAWQHMGGHRHPSSYLAQLFLEIKCTNHWA